MSQTLTLELNDDIYTTLRRDAEAAGVSLVDWAVRVLERSRPPQPAHDASSRARERRADLVDFFRASPLVGEALDFERSRDRGREIDL